MRDGKVCYGIIGCGVIGPFHAKGVMADEKGELIAVCDVALDKAKVLAAEYGDVPAYASCAEMIDSEPDLDAVTLCTPSGLHHQDAMVAIEKGKHVLTEKPIEITLEKIDAMIDAAKKNNVKLGCIFQKRTIPMSRQVRDALQRGDLGKMVLGDCYQKYYRSPEYYESAGWRGTWKLDGGGALMNQAVHGIDLLLWLMGEVESVFAYAAPMVRNIEVEDTAVAVLKFKNGAMGVLEGTTSVTPGEVCRFELHGQNGTIIFDEQEIKRWAVAKETAGIAEDVETDAQKDKDKKMSTSDPKNIGAEGHIMQVGDFSEAILSDREPMVPGPEARKAVELILAIYRSAQTGTEVKLPLT